MKTSHAILWIAVWACTLVLTTAYLFSLNRQHPGFFKHPIRYAQSILANTLDYADRDPPGRMLLEAEKGQIVRGAWKDVANHAFSNSAARFTNEANAEMAWDISLPPDEYEVKAVVYTYSKKSRNELSISIGDQPITFSWNGSSPERRIVLQKTIKTSQPANHIALRAEKITQPQLLIDCLLITSVHDAQAEQHRNLMACLGAIAAVVGLFLGSLGWGTFLMRRIIGHPKDPTVRLALSQGLGLATMGTLVTILGTIGIFNLPVVGSSLLMGVVLGARPLAALLAQWRRETALFRDAHFTIVALGLMGIMFLATLGALAPAVGVDPLIYHLSIAKWLVTEGRFNPHPYHIVWGFPHLVSNLYAISLLLFNDTVFRPAVLTHAAMGLLWIVSAYASGKALWGRRAGMAAAVLVASSEGMTYCFTLALADLGFTSLAVCSLLAFIQAIQNWERREGRRYLLVASIIAGAAAVCKVNGPTIAIAMGISAALYGWVRTNWKTGLSALVLVGFTSLAVASPMYIKNYLIYGNPLHPFSCGFTSPDLVGLNAWALFGNADWRSYVARTGPTFVYRWVYDWMSKKGVDWLCPGPAFAVGLLLFLVSGRAWAKRHWPYLVWAAVLMALWFAISPLARFGWPWITMLTLLACAPLGERPVSRLRILLPALMLAVAIIPLVAEMERPLRMWNIVRGESSQSAYFEKMDEYHAGPNMGPPRAAIRALNEEYHNTRFEGRVLIDTNLVAFADFPTVPAWYYLIVQTAQGRNWWNAGVYPFLSMTGKSVNDDEMLAEMRRLNVTRILAKKGTPVPQPGSDGRYHCGPNPEKGYGPEERFNDFMERWVREGRAEKKDFSDGTLYILLHS